jgi:hypothetical protein
VIRPQEQALSPDVILKDLANLMEVPMNPVAKACAAALFLTLGASAALAQTPGAGTGCTPQERANQALQKSDAPNAGVICPPDVDRAMKAPTPKTGDTSVIPPPDSPGAPK